MGDSLEDADAVGVVRKLHADAENKQIKQVDTARRLYKLLSLGIKTDTARRVPTDFMFIMDVI